MKTLDLLTRYLKQFNEQDELDTELADATNIGEQPEAQIPPPLTSEGEKYLINIAIKAFLHQPDESESKIVKELQSTVFEDNPKDVIEHIENFLEISPVDTERALDTITDIGS